MNEKRSCFVRLRGQEIKQHRWIILFDFRPVKALILENEFWGVCFIFSLSMLGLGSDLSYKKMNRGFGFKSKRDRRLDSPLDLYYEAKI